MTPTKHSAERVTEERQRVAMALLNRPWIAKRDDAELYALAREHYEGLRDWFSEQTGWTLLLTRHFVKLEKTPTHYRSWMAFAGFREPRDYGLFTYGLWFLEGLADADQFLLSEMAETIREHLIGQRVHMDWSLYDHRLSMSRALRKLRDLGVLIAVEGDETDWARAGGDSNVLYEASPLARYVLRGFPQDLMRYGSISDFTDAPTEWESQAPDVSDGQALRNRRHRVMRRLLIEPVVYDWQWAEDERRYVQTQRTSLIDRVRQMTGLEGRRYGEGLVFTWPELTGDMELYPTSAAISDVAMLLAREIRGERLRAPQRMEWDGQQSLLLTHGELETTLGQLREQYAAYWSKELREKTVRQLAADVMDHLREWNLGDADREVIRLHAGFACYQADYEWGAE